MADENNAPVQDGGENTVADLTALLEKKPAPDRRTTDTTDKGASPTREDASPAAEPADDSAADEGVGQEEAPVTEGEDEGDGDPDRVIAAPRSWSAEAREAFADLPPDLQRVIAERDSEQQSAFNRQVNEAAEKRKAADAELQAASNERRQYLQAINGVIGQLAAQTANEFSDITTTGDLERLASEDPARYLRWQARRDALMVAEADRQAAYNREQQEQSQRNQGYLAEQRKLLFEKIPEFADPAKGKALASEATTYLRTQGFTDAEIGNVVDHRMALVVRDAALYRKSQAAAKTAADKKVVNVPKVSKPGAASDRADRAAGDKAAFTSIARHGTTDQQAAALTRMLEKGS
jgi:hypothetical protein